ncbi:zinc-binding dehydrogenase [Sporolactobacillus pectinivorans]|uniref:zinc-binding dehydrogenase n=1 Tax=Sporolactobacillus pectinivorans TaxID=1591408 RepID=UPI000C26B41B|nr:zinc-binding dehydrogenase [Sporolactobacillus pectinivorans]
MKGLCRYGTEIGGFHFEENLPEPEISDDDLLIEVKAAGICGADLKHYDIDNGATTGKRIAGHEFSGVVVKAGKNVIDWKVGDRVVSENTGYVCGKCYACSVGNYLLCPHKRSLGLSVGMDGGFTKYVKIPGQVMQVYKNCLFQIPDNVSFEEAAMLDPIGNAYMSVAQRSNLLPGDHVVIFGAGPIGLLCLEMAKLMGAAEIILVASSRNRHVRFKVAEKLGATHCIAYDEENVADRVKEIVGEYNIPIVFDCAGSPQVLEQALQIVRSTGQIVRVGMSYLPLNFSINDLSMKAITLTGHMAYNTVSLKHSLRLLERGMIDAKSLITHRLPLSEWEKGFKLMKSRDAIKVILHYDD